MLLSKGHKERTKVWGVVQVCFVTYCVRLIVRHSDRIILASVSVVGIVCRREVPAADVDMGIIPQM